MKILIFFTCSLMFSLSIFFMTLTIKNIQDIKEKGYVSAFDFKADKNKKKYNFFKF